MHGRRCWLPAATGDGGRISDHWHAAASDCHHPREMLSHSDQCAKDADDDMDEWGAADSDVD